MVSMDTGRFRGLLTRLGLLGEPALVQVHSCIPRECPIYSPWFPCGTSTCARRLQCVPSKAGFPEQAKEELAQFRTIGFGTYLNRSHQFLRLCPLSRLCLYVVIIDASICIPRFLPQGS